MLGNWGKLHEPRIGIMLHYDASASDPSAVAWLTRDSRCKVSYTDLFLDNGDVVPIAPRNARAWHAGVCRPSSRLFTYKDANSAFYGFAIAASGKDNATQAQIDSLVRECAGLFRKHGWKANEVWRITDHEAECWPRKRKVDVFGDRKTRTVAVLDVQAVRDGVAKELL